MSLRLITSTDAAYRAGLIARYATTSDWAEELALLAEAATYDRHNPGGPSLSDELYGARLGDTA